MGQQSLVIKNMAIAWVLKGAPNNYPTGIAISTDGLPVLWMRDFDPGSVEAQLG